MARLIVMRKGGGGKVAVNPDLVSFVRSAAGAYTDLFIAGQQVAVEGTFDEVIARLAGRGVGPGDADRRDEEGERRDPGLVFGRLGR